MSNSWGKLWRITTYGESHGPAIGVIIDGCPAGLTIDTDQVQAALDKRKPGQSALSTERKENDRVVIESGIFEGVTTGTPIHLKIKNKDARSKDYEAIRQVYRPSHADYSYEAKYGHRDYRGGGRASARETACRVAAGAIAQQFLSHWDIEVYAFVNQIGSIKVEKDRPGEVNYEEIERQLTRCPDPVASESMEAAIHSARKDKDSLGGQICGHILNVPPGLGEPIYDKLHARLGAAMLSINAVKGFSYGSGFAASGMRGSEHNDAFVVNKGKLGTTSNHSGGIQGGISNGMPIYFHTAFKPVASIGQKQASVNDQGEAIDLAIEGRHDPCVVPRAVPIVEAMAALTMADFILLQQRQNVL